MKFIFNLILNTRQQADKDHRLRAVVRVWMPTVTEIRVLDQFRMFQGRGVVNQRHE